MSGPRRGKNAFLRFDNRVKISYILPFRLSPLFPGGTSPRAPAGEMKNSWIPNR